MNGKMRGRILLALKVGVTLTLLIVSFRMIEFDQLKESLRGANPWLLGCSSLALAGGGFAGAASWFFVLRVHFPNLAYREVAGCHWSGMFFNSFLPSNVGGDVVKGFIVARDQGKTGFVVTSLLLDRILNLSMLLSIGIITLLVHLDQVVWALLFFIFLFVALVVAMASSRWLGGKVRSWPPCEGIKGRIIGLIDPVFDLLSTPGHLIPALIAALISQFLKTLQSVFVILALGLGIPTFYVWFVIPLFGVVSALPVSIGGLGLREMVAQGISGPMHLDNTDLVLLSLAGHLMVVGVNMLGIIPFIFSKGKQKR